MVRIGVEYQGDLRCRVKHAPSEQSFQTDAPIDNHGKGERISPTDLCAAALGSCMATIIGIQLKSKETDLSGMKVDIEKEMSNDLPRRIASLRTVITVPVEMTEAEKAILEDAAKTCPVYHSLHPDIDKSISINWA